MIEKFSYWIWSNWMRFLSVVIHGIYIVFRMCLKGCCWIPAFGILFEQLYTVIYDDNYLSDPDKQKRYNFSIKYHFISIPIIVILIIWFTIILINQ